jgi:hypothetical protein
MGWLLVVIGGLVLLLTGAYNLAECIADRYDKPETVQVGQCIFIYRNHNDAQIMRDALAKHPDAVVRTEITNTPNVSP